jgi:hypothetical protein
MRKKIVVFADGTGNAFTVQQSNIWRLYESLDQTQPDQVAHYIKGVGTSGFKPIAVLDGVTGFGVPSNVRKLYKFICRNWSSGDEIYMFGFSRGAFTIRTLIGLMHHEGLVPTEIGNETVSRAEMQRNVKGAWRFYRSKTVPWYKTFPTIWIARSIRNVVVLLSHLVTRWLLGHRLYKTVKEETEKQGRVKVPIKFVGLFDTVEAYGVPLEELRRAVDVAIWPISFQNNVLSEHVESARHALSLDDERTTFHPLRIDLQKSENPARIKEVWFAGVHSDVGGGYPEDDLAYVPLNWMLGEIGSGLRFIGGKPEEFAANASPYASAHDSRGGLSVFYRYSPRPVGDNGGPPVIHYSVAEKMALGPERYAPVTLPDTAMVVLPDGNSYPICGFDPSNPDVVKSGPLTPETMRAWKAVEELKDPDPAIVSLAQDNIWRRRVAYFALLFSAFVIALLPWTVRSFTDWLRETFSKWPLGKQIWENLANTDQGGSAFVSGIFQYVGTMLPGYAKPWADALIDRPTVCGIVIAIAIVLYLWNGSLRDRIADLAREAWLPREKTAYTEEQVGKLAKKTEKRVTGEKAENPDGKPKAQVPRTLVGWIRTSPLVAFFECAVNRYLLPAVGVLLIFAAVGVLISRTAVAFRDGRGEFCKASTSPEPLKEGKAVSRDNFTTDQLCWASGMTLKKGHHYTLSIEMTEPYFFDQTIVTDAAGFKDNSPVFIVTWFVRRWLTADWFQPVARIGNTGIDAWPLVSADGDTAVPTGKDRDGNEIPRNVYPSRLDPDGKIPQDELKAANDIRANLNLRKIYVSNFIAPNDGELFLYVNDALIAVPFLKTFAGFYKNNTGKAKVTVKLLTTPPPS